MRATAIYAATSPDGKVYRLVAGAKPEVFYDPKAKYIWALAFNKSGDLLVATGDPGAIHRVTPTAAAACYSKRRDAHAFHGGGWSRQYDCRAPIPAA